MSSQYEKSVPRRHYAKSIQGWSTERQAKEILAGQSPAPCICRVDHTGRRWLNVGCHACTGRWRPDYDQR